MSTNRAAANDRISITEFFDGRPLTSYQAEIFALCLCVTLLDGFDSQSIGVAGPSIAQMLHLSP
jgi:hypothetical protein